MNEERRERERKTEKENAAEAEEEEKNKKLEHVQNARQTKINIIANCVDGGKMLLNYFSSKSREFTRPQLVRKIVPFTIFCSLHQSSIAIGREIKIDRGEGEREREEGRKKGWIGGWEDRYTKAEQEEEEVEEEALTNEKNDIVNLSCHSSAPLSQPVLLYISDMWVRSSRKRRRKRRLYPLHFSRTASL